MPDVAFRSSSYLDIDILQFGQLALILFLELSQTPLELGDLFAKLFALGCQEADRLRGSLLTLTKVFVQEQANQFVNDALGDFWPLVFVRQVEGDGRLHWASLPGVNNVRAHRRNGNIIAHVLYDGLKRCAFAFLSVQVVLLNDGPEIRGGQHSLGNDLDALIREARDHGTH